MDGPNRYAHFENIPAEKVEKLGKILRKMEDHVVEDFLKAHPKDWYIDKISEFAKVGGLDEKQFYAMIGYTHPGVNRAPVSKSSALRDAFKKVIADEPAELAAAKSFKQGLTQTTAAENMDKAMSYFEATLKEQLHSALPHPISTCAEGYAALTPR
jgi:hypothetical protein